MKPNDLPAGSPPGPSPSPIPPSPPDPGDDAILRRTLTRKSFLGLAWSGLAGLAALGGWRWLVTRPLEDGRPWPFRRVLEFNERVARTAFRADARAPEFPRDRAGALRVNGMYGLRDGGPGSPVREVDPASYRLAVSWPGGERSLTLAEIRGLPRVDQVAEFKCIEGWSQVVHWAGVRLADLVDRLGLGDVTTPYVALETIGGGYYVGLDWMSALHPQTLLAFELNGAPLTPAHGSPLRLVIPVKYGIKNIKQVGSIRFAADRPRDFWAERGYDWYAGL